MAIRRNRGGWPLPIPWATWPCPRFVACGWVCTARQCPSGLRLEAQRKTIEDFARSRSVHLIGRLTQAESGRNPVRPESRRGLRPAKVTGATLVSAKLDRLSLERQDSDRTSSRHLIAFLMPRAHRPSSFL